MALTLNDHKSLLKGFISAGYSLVQMPAAVANPIILEWHQPNKSASKFRLWAFEITHGGGGAEVRAADEFRIQITNGPEKVADLDSGGATDLLIGYSPDRDAIVAYDRRWLENWTKKKQQSGSGGSPSVQVKEADIEAGRQHGVHHITKNAGFGAANIVTLNPTVLPAFLANHQAVLGGAMSATTAGSATPPVGSSNVVEYCASQGFPFETDLVARYVAAFLAKPFIILAGVSGTGKSKLAELVAEFYTGKPSTGIAGSSSATTGGSFVFVPATRTPDRSRFALVAVRPDWIDNQSVIGFVNPITNQYESTQALDLILRANKALGVSTDKNAAPRHFMLLDEMNLARVEHYFSDWLACVESRRFAADGTLMQQPVPLHRSDKPMKAMLRNEDGSVETADVPPVIGLPTNLVVTGTVNVDETTYGFSPKVLDRAMVLEFDEVDLERLRGSSTSVNVGAYRLPTELEPFRLATHADYAKLPVGAHQHLVRINDILAEARLHFGYRTANEMALFMTIYNNILPPDNQDTEWLRALDAALLQKVLPRLSGNRSKLELPLATLTAYFRDLTTPKGEIVSMEFDPKATAKLRKSYTRAIEMLESLRDFGFVSFFK
jgi:hypothetical protein